MAAAQQTADDMYPQLLDNAYLCAHSEACSIESAEQYLREIVLVQSGCAAGTLSGSSVCDDVLGVSAIVADLRDKIGEGARRVAAPPKPAHLGIAAVCAILAVAVLQPAATDIASGGVVPFTAQEVGWAIQGGYLNNLVGHLLNNGGLLVADSPGAVGGSLSPQELAWSLRDGYLWDALFSSGGGGAESLPFTPREIWWAVEGGYASDLAEHWFHNGGLSV